MNSLHGLFVKELGEFLVMEKKIMEALPKMAAAATDEKLKAGFEEHLTQTKNQVTRLETVMKGLNEEPAEVEHPVIDAMIAKGEEIINMDGDEEVRDVALIAAAQKVEHLEIACYGTAIEWAKLMKHDEAVELLKETLGEEEATDKKLTELAEGGILMKGLNAKAHE